MSEIEAYLMTQPPLTIAVTGFLCRDGQILLGVRKRVSDDLGRGILAGIGGKVESGETNEQALARECMEEIGVQPTGWKSVGVNVCLFPHRPEWNQVVKLYLVEAWAGEPQETEAIRPLWFLQKQLPIERMWPDNALVVPHLLASQHSQGVFLYASDGSIAEHRLEFL